ncbi:5-(carboxyamino)imidazole ribonucleotide synthase [Acetobacter ghanensis]|uniref:N5-carboxyaminoimidazole ribonucleotide synthase n=1 Tax=Acetobacter ghanensis TaxID=431306 RepID=A0A0U5BJ15_9PROT|nr:5-(carboxyamino)imidazole ribonucleotide synthase [Acetobacter ghanensis]NHO38345.1 5-(carboxyamino)imidazole ribonucleotide synthase [Acetobacter ghanensis]GBQ47128.1 phosphoribosylaminoimidazole carboxylase ATPase subunit [Acetobacter ghanensis DSM 18895]CEF55613.1 5-(carboxyamino)imidazole ribonucleotide synthase [Acetobacter ghanensis]
MTQTHSALAPNAVIGIVGGGQLGRMSAVAASRLGFKTHILTQDAHGPAAQVSSAVTLGAYDDPDALDAFAKAVDVVTFEFENINADALDRLSRHCPVRPSGHILRISQDRLAEKTFLASAGVPLAPWHAVTDRATLHEAARKLGFPLILKTTRNGYDGKGQRRVYTEAELDEAFEALAPHPLVAEGMVDFACELSVMVVRGTDGTTRCFDTVLNHHWHGILDLTLAPAPVAENVAQEAGRLAAIIAEKFDLIGIMGVEMFLTRDGSLMINEVAPRPHNSGHWTMDACPQDQFDMHIRAVAGLPLPAAIRHSDAVMKNLVGPEDMALWPAILANPGHIPHLYGKKEARPGRKMGHVNILFPYSGLPGEWGIQAALGPLATKCAAPPAADED